jgi:PST family polysaccharide transporter
MIAKSRPHLGFDATIALTIFRGAVSFSFANLIWQLRLLVNPLIVGPALGARAVGLVGMTINLLETLSVIKTIVWRLSVVILVRFQGDTEKLRRAVREGMELQALTVGTIIVGFGWFGHIIIPWLFGERWLPVIDIYPYLALGYFTNTIFNMHSSVLFLMKRNIDVAIFHMVHIVIFTTTVAFFIVPLGIIGYGVGELTALLSYAVIHFFLARIVGSPFYLPTAIWWLGIAIGLFWRDLGLWAISACFLALVVPPSPSRLLFYYHMLKRR